MKRWLILAGISWLAASVPAGAADYGRVTAETEVEIGRGVFFNRGTDLVLLNQTLPASALFGRKSYWQVNVGSWNGEYSAGVAGVARGLQWDIGEKSYMRLSSGVSLVSETSDRLSTAFQFYEQFLIATRARNLTFSFSFRHWSNAYIKAPNLGMDFATVNLEYRW